MVSNSLDDLSMLEPPEDLAARHGGLQFRDIGRRWLDTFKLIAGLRRDDHILDVGCGAGRMTLALAPYLGVVGRYEGFDVNSREIEWCRKEIEPRWPRSHFRLVDVRNASYNPTGAVPAREFRFPYNDGTFDFVFLTSVFTHMLPEEMRNYLSEITRVLNSGGRCLITYFILNDKSRTAILNNKARLNFQHSIHPCAYVQHRHQPEKAVAYDEAFLRKQYFEVGLQIKEPIHFGGWSGSPVSPAPRHSQDIIVAFKS